MTITIPLIPDTQNLTRQFPAAAPTVADYIKSLTPVAVIQVGDMVDGPNTSWWAVFAGMYDRMSGPWPVSTTIGNHDYPGWDDAQTQRDLFARRASHAVGQFRQFVPISKVRNVIDVFPANEPTGNVVQTFEAEGHKFAIIALSCWPLDSELAWLESMIRKYADRNIIINAHDYMNQTTRSDHGNRIWAIVRKYANVTFIFGGHYFPTAGHRSDRGDKGNVVHQMMIDYQDADSRDPNTYIQILKIDTVLKTVTVRTYSPILDRDMLGLNHAFALADVNLIGPTTTTPPSTPPSGGNSVATLTIQSGVNMDSVANKLKTWAERALAAGGMSDAEIGQMYITSANRGSSGVDYHTDTGSNGALDIAAPMTDAGQRLMQKASRILIKDAALLLEMIHSTPYDDDNGFYIKNGQFVPASYYGEPNYSDNGHINHIHTATSETMGSALIAKYPAAGGGPAPTPTPTPTPTPAPDTSVTQFGLDIYDFTVNDGLTEANVRSFVHAGISFMNAKFTEFDGGTVYEHRQAARMLRAATDEGLKFPMGFIVPRTGPSIDAQIDKLLAFADREFPQWRTHPDFSWQVDLEHWDYDAVAPGIGAEMAKRLMVRTQKPAILYAAPWAYGNTVPNYPGRKLWASNYDGSGASRDYKAMYIGNSAPGWAAYSGSVPTINQYCSDGIVAGYGPLVMSAFRGTEADFRAMLADAVRPYLTNPPPAPDPTTPPSGGTEMQLSDKVPAALTADNQNRTVNDVLGDLWHGVHIRLPAVEQDVDAIKARLESEPSGGAPLDYDKLAEALLRRIASS